MGENMSSEQSANLFTGFSPESRVWIFSFGEPLSPEARAKILASLQNFVSSWKAHGHPVRGAVEIPHSRFAVFCADPRVSDISGCSIDGMFRAASKAATEVGASLLSEDFIFFRNGDEINSVSRSEFKELGKAGTINGQTRVFDNTVQSLEDFKARWESEAGSSWHQKLLASPQTAPF